MAWVNEQIESGQLRIGEITDVEDLRLNPAENAIPSFIDQVDASNYPDFLDVRRQLMAEMIRKYYEEL